MIGPVTSDEGYKGAGGRWKGCDCYGRGRETPRLDRYINQIFWEVIKVI